MEKSDTPLSSLRKKVFCFPKKLRPEAEKEDFPSFF